MNTKSKSISLVASLLLLTTGLTACSEKAAAPVAAKPKPAQSAPAAPAPAPAAAPAPAKPAVKAELNGKAIYDTRCMACHAMAVAGAPKFGDKEVWAPRLAKGIEALYDSSINGIQGEAGIMPPKGGFMNLTDDEVKAAVDYMVEAVK